jgi:hypothetical protein
MSDIRWSDILSRLSPDRLLDLGDLGDRASASAAGTGPLGGAAPPVAALWARGEGSTGCLGLRVRAPVEDVTATAARLAAIAVERGVQPVILSHVGETGFERLGFRVERIAAPDKVEAARQEAELAAFWDIAMILDLEEVPGLR